MESFSSYYAPSARVAGPAIVIDEASKKYELESDLRHTLPVFFGNPEEDSLRFIQHFEYAVNNLSKQWLEEEQVKCVLFPLVMRGNAKDWLWRIAPGSLTSWEDILKAFYKFLPTLKDSEGSKRNI